MVLKKQDSISQAYKELKILKFPDLLYLQNFLFMSQFEMYLLISEK